MERAGVELGNMEALLDSGAGANVINIETAAELGLRRNHSSKEGDKELISGERIDVYNNGSLVIGHVSRSDDGSYTCTATSRRGLSASRSANVKVIGRYLPELETRFSGF